MSTRKIIVLRIVFIHKNVCHNMQLQRLRKKVLKSSEFPNGQ